MISKFFHDLYEHPTLKPYRLNFCDVGAFRLLQPFGRAIRAFGSYCACCSGVRVIVALALGAAFREQALLAAAAILVALTIRETWWPTQ